MKLLLRIDKTRNCNLRRCSCDFTAWRRSHMITLSAFLVLCNGDPSLDSYHKNDSCGVLIFVVISMKKLSNLKKCPWIETSWRSCDITVLTGIYNLIWAINGCAAVTPFPENMQYIPRIMRAVISFAPGLHVSHIYKTATVQYGWIHPMTVHITKE